MRIQTLYIMTLLAGLLVSCSSIPDEEIIRERDQVGISFTLSMNSAGVSSRTLTSDQVTDYENTIDPGQFRVLAYNTDGNVHEVTIFSIEQISNNTYKISGVLEGNHRVNKVVILTNCDTSFNSSTSPLNSLIYNYSSSRFNPEAPLSYLPMWGEKAITSTLEPGKSTNLGTIYLMRAMAKVSVKAMGQEELSSITMAQVNDRGLCVPDSRNVTGSGENLSVTAPTIPGGTGKIATVGFYMLNSREAFIYLPEQSKNDQLQMIVRLGGKDYTLYFKDYSSNEYFDVSRNTYYEYKVTVKQNVPDLDFKVEYKVVPWGSENIDIGFD